MGTIGLTSAAIALAFLAGVNIYTRDSNVWDDEISSVRDRPGRRAAPGQQHLADGVRARRGRAHRRPRHLSGRLRRRCRRCCSPTGAEWTAEAWAERASADAAYNAEVRSRIANPLEFPLAAAIGIGVIVYSFSRIMLWLSKTNTVIAFVVLGVIILTVAFLAAYRPGPQVAGRGRRHRGRRARHSSPVVPRRTRRRARDRGARDHRGLTEEGEEICLSPEEFEADEKASQSVAATANVAAEITLTESGDARPQRASARSRRAPTRSRCPARTRTT